MTAAMLAYIDEIELTVGEETHEKLLRLQALLSTQIPDGDPGTIIDRALGELLERTLARKAGVTERPRSRRSSERPGRHIPAEVRRDVWARDGGRCAYVSADGHRCEETHFLEYHHREPYARGGGHDASNIELRCRAHNQHAADLDYGKLFMDDKRDRGARETLAPYRSTRIPRFFVNPASSALVGESCEPSGMFVRHVPRHCSSRSRTSGIGS